jgi:hypothetical protein
MGRTLKGLPAHTARKKVIQLNIASERRRTRRKLQIMKQLN